MVDDALDAAARSAVLEKLLFGEEMRFAWPTFSSSDAGSDFGEAQGARSGDQEETADLKKMTVDQSLPQ